MRRWPLSIVGAMIVGVLVVASPPLRVAVGGDEPGLNRITQVQPGMTMLQVLQTLGPPSDIAGNTFYYKMHGKVIFASKGSPLDKTLVEKIEPNPTQNPVP